MILACHYCNEEDDNAPKNWYKSKELGELQGHEVEYDMHNEEKDNRILLTSDHNLVIYNFSSNDTGLYYCKSFASTGTNDTFTFLVDMVIVPNASDNYQTGNLSEWKDYHDKYVHPVNDKLKQSDEIKYLKESMNLSLEVINHWGPWGECDSCGEGKRKRMAYCRVKVVNKMKTLRGKIKKEQTKLEKFLMNADEISCGSKTLNDYFPDISLATKIVPYFVQEDKCEAVCGPDKYKQYLIGKSPLFKHRKTYIIAEGSHLILVCPESSIDSKITWNKEGSELPSGTKTDHMIVDAFNSVYIIDATKNEEGNYTCIVNKMRMLKVKVFVLKKSFVLSAKFGRYLIYFGFILSLTLSCFCAGMVISFTRRGNFLTYEQLKEDEEKGIQHKFLF
ncbi:uncharacterized protein LOC126265316 [Aethina tumida]|uniref:uncharacterized protein LOC126265316 n=1 Tax=Aethina tumida TaxID=116153 RepID=UPI00214792A5|nr:uncharacterized protein LOC126265316 [Aethina tumida]